jgi:hypothetical protein
MARVHNFVMCFDPVELTGTFEGELVHAVAPDDPQLESSSRRRALPRVKRAKRIRTHGQEPT